MTSQHSKGRVAGKVALVTGAAMGMGAAHARLLVAEGAKVAVTDVNDQLGKALAEELGDAALFVHLNVTSESEWQSAIAATEAAFGPINILVNNAGIVDLAPLDEMTEARYRRIIDINQIGPFLGMRATVGSMRKAGGGSMINISSVTAFAPAAHLSGYIASKLALAGMSKVASLDFAADNIRVNTILPGIFDTPMNAGASGSPSRQAMKRMGRPEELAAMVLFLASDESSFCTGAEYVVDGGYANTAGEILI